MSKTPIQLLLEAKGLRTKIITHDKANITTIMLGLYEWTERELMTRGIVQTYYSGDDLNENIIDLLLWIAESHLKAPEID